MAITISDTWLGQIKRVLAFPDIENLLLTDDQIKEYCVFPSLQKYFTKFPIMQEATSSINGEVFISFPDTYTFGVLDARVVDIGLVGGSGGSFWDLVAWQSYNNSYISSKTTGAYGKKGYNPSGLIYQRDVQRQTLKSQQNQYVTLKTRVDYTNKRLIAYSSISGVLNITWAKYSDNFDDVIYERKDDVVKLCQSELIQHLANSAAILTDSALEISINVDYLNTKAQELKQEIEDKWREIPDVILIHGV